MFNEIQVDMVQSYNGTTEIARRLPVWKAEQMAPIGRVTMVNAVLISIPIYLLMAINVPKWVIKRIDKVHRGFLWASGAAGLGN